ncbi:MAG TPA: Hsp70 family protein [Anaeromyxobacteraceae bacterium]|nr:Hsp70 family protein [Anaeromyxobacteraceae bacterium]
MTDSRFIVGIDLGTTNSALAAIDLGREGDLVESLAVVPVPQLVAAGELAERPLLPSAAYVPGEHELPPGSRALPWGEPEVVVGEWAKVQGSRVPGRLVASAKSWLSHPRVDRTAPILPWGAPEGVTRLSPVDASALFLGHLRAAWDHAHPQAPLAAQEVVLTVPASFDEGARELTVRAARQAGLARLTLLEEPQAAFHDWAARHRADLQAALAGASLVLVVDVGGGTTDFTLIHAAVKQGTPTLTRIAVGDHLLLGGDNVDITLARRVEHRLGARLDAVQWSTLVQACRAAKEALLAERAPASAGVSVAGRGSRLVGGTLSAEITRAEVREVLLEGFFPAIGPEDVPRRAGRAGLLELGLPYESEPAITRHALAFLRDHATEVAEAIGRPVATLPRPDAILLNGGVFTPREVRERLRDVMSSWFPGEPVSLLENARLDVAVARGAASSGLVRRGVGLRIGGGSARAYYVAVDAPGEAARALCVIPRHLEEGREIAVPRTFSLLVDRPVRFRVYATRRARFDQPGDLVDLDEAAFQPLPPIETVLRAPGGGKAEIPVRLHAALTDIGTLELWCVAEDRDARWKLEFQLRGTSSDTGPTEVEAMPRRFADARALVELYYGKKAAAVDPRAVKGLFRELEKVLGPRDGWTTPVIRELWASLHAAMPRRRRSADHERLWCSLTGWCLRPGFGAPLDSWRAAETFRAFGEGLQFQSEPHNWQAWWILWRRIAGGLDEAAQARILELVMPFVPPADPRKAKPRVAGVRAEAIDELIRLAASLERVPADRKRDLGEAVFARVEREGAAPHLLWAIGRIGARVPFHGSAHTSVPKEVAEDWISRLLALPTSRAELAFPLSQLARASGDRARDVEPEVRDAVLAALAQARAPEDVIRPVREAVALGAAEEQRIFGDALPAGLRLIA